ncbi:DUF2079 domain-containing protein [Actinocrispum wychmicini]|uniref:Putative membrane protein n=1 Tax=Actinocrispum wychmicini TaxID=1213861 RepID=A0A4R2J598_9PSEU|nr:DUF2079 domain-containing protein [Actinocrispum wychmicini]TCO53057.1 putative membrane protein [Actinocrispum wychmicini]
MATTYLTAAADSGPRPDGQFAGHGRRRRDPYLLAAGFFVIYAVLSTSRYLNFKTMSWDLGIFEQVIGSYARLQPPVSDLKGPGFLILGDHFSPMVALISPFYRLFPTAITMLIAQALLFALAVVPVTRTAARLLGRANGVAIGVAYGLSWGVQRAVDFDFHEICFAVPMIAFALEALVHQRWRTALAWALPLVLVKEDLGLTAAAIAMLVALRARHTQPRIVTVAISVGTACVLACVVTVGVVIPGFSAAGDYDYWSKLSSAGGLAGGDIDEKVRTLLWILLPTTGLLALRSPLLLASVPTLAWRFLSNDEHYWSTDWHYNAVLMPIVTLALVDAIPRLRHNRLRAYAHHLPLALSAVALALSTALPVASLTHAETYRTGPEARAADQALATIPDRASVEANIVPSAHLAPRCQVYWIGDTRGITPDYIAYYDATMTWQGVLDYARRLHPNATYTPLIDTDGYWILRRVSPG